MFWLTKIVKKHVDLMIVRKKKKKIKINNNSLIIHLFWWNRVNDCMRLPFIYVYIYCDLCVCV